MIVRKYWYQRKFKSNSNEELLSEGWEKRYTTFFDGVVKLLKDKDNIFEKIQVFNKWDSIIPTDEQLNKVKLSSELVKNTFEQFHFTNLTE